MFDLFKKPELPHEAVTQSGLVYQGVDVSKLEAREIERIFARLFLSEDGQKVLGHLQAITFQRALGPGAADEQLRYLEGQRAMVATILRLIDRGRNPG